MNPTCEKLLESENDEFDIYADLDDTNDVPSNKKVFQQQQVPLALDDTLNDEALFYNELNSLENEVKELRQTNKTLSEENATLKANLAAKERQLLVLKNNISSLFKTAKIELDRRASELADLRREYDSLIFRRIKKEDISYPGAMESNQLSKSMVSVSTDTSDLRDYNPTKENIKSRQKDQDNCRNESDKYRHSKDYDEDRYRNKNREFSGSYDGKRKHSPLSVRHDIDLNRSKSTKYDAEMKSARSSSRKEYVSKDTGRSHSRYSDSYQRMRN